MPNNRRKSAIWKPSKEEFKKIFDECYFVGEMLSKFNLRNKGSNYQTLQKRFIEDGIDWKKFRDNKVKKKSKIIFRPRILTKDILVENSPCSSRHILKTRLIRENLLENKCYICNLGPKWNNKNLVMVLDHINGISNDNRLENLRFLCPNCNSQTDTFAGRNLKYDNIIKRIDDNSIQENKERKQKIIKVLQKKLCIQCGKEICKQSIRCSDCSRKSPRFEKRKIDRPSKEELQKLVWSTPTIKLAERFGVTDKAIGKWCRSYNIEKPGRGYWAKQKSIGA